MGVHIGPQALYFVGIHRSSNLIFYVTLQSIFFKNFDKDVPFSKNKSGPQTENHIHSQQSGVADRRDADDRLQSGLDTVSQSIPIENYKTLWKRASFLV